MTPLQIAGLALAAIQAGTKIIDGLKKSGQITPADLDRIDAEAKAADARLDARLKELGG